MSDHSAASSPENLATSPLGDLVIAYLESKSNDPAPSHHRLQQWLNTPPSADEDQMPDVDWNGTYSSSAASELRRWAYWMQSRDHRLEDLQGREAGTGILRRYARRLRRRAQGESGIAPSTAETYWAYIRACLQWGVRDGRLPWNPAQSEDATEELPSATADRSEQQHWTPEQRDRLLSHVKRDAYETIDEEGRSAAGRQAARDRALVAVLYFSAVRIAEVCRHPRDERPGRQGLRWKNVDLDAGKIRIFGKGEQTWLWHPLPGPSTRFLDRLQDIQAPASEDWPVFATGHAPTRTRVLTDELGADALEKADADREALLREYDIAPPALTTEGARSRLRHLTEQAGIEVPGDDDYLQPHGARRGMIGEVFKRDRGEAQDLGRHSDMGTTEDAYRHLDVEDQRDRLDGLIDEIEDTT